MITISSQNTRLKTQHSRWAYRLMGSWAHGLISLSAYQPTNCPVPCLFPVLFAFVISLSYNGPAYGTAEHERQDMNQRARAALEEILSAEEFKDQDSQPPWWLRLGERLFDHLPGRAKWVGTVLEWLFYLAAALVTVSVFIFIAKRFRRLPLFTTDHNVPTGPRVRGDQLHMDPGAARERAYECSQRGDYRQAIRYLYLSFLLYLDKAGLLTYDAGKTNGEILSEVYGSMGNQAERFAFLTLFFERKWYGTEESSVADFRQCKEAVDGLVGSQTHRLIDP